MAGAGLAALSTGATNRRMASVTVGMVGAAVAALVAVLIWTASADHLADDYRLQGWDFNAAAEQFGPAAGPEDAVHKLGVV